MTSRPTRAIAESHYGEAMLDQQAALERLRHALPPPRDPHSLVEEASIFSLTTGRIAVDIGAGRGDWSARLVERFGCTCVALDVARSRLRDARDQGVPAVVADADVLPFATESIDVVWCRDALEMLEDPVAVLREFSRVLVPGGGCLVYVPMPTELLDQREQAELLRGGAIATWWPRGRAALDEAVGAAGFDVLAFSITSPEFAESLLLHDPHVVTSQLLEHVQLRRGRDEMEAAVGSDWYQSFLTWSRWQMYLILGKIETGLWLLRKPASA